MYRIPISNLPNQTFTSTIPVDGKKLRLHFFLKYNTEQKCWVMNLSDERRNPLVSAIPLVCGVNLLEQHSYLNIGSAYIAKLDPNTSGDRPDEFDLGKEFILVWGDTL